MAAPFFGKPYRYGTLKDGEQTIGVCEISGGFWVVAWVGEDSRRHRIVSKGLPQTLKAETAQSYLDQWAALHKLLEVER